MEKEWALSDTNTNFVLSDFFFFCFNSLSLLLCGSTTDVFCCADYLWFGIVLPLLSCTYKIDLVQNYQRMYLDSLSKSVSIMQKCVKIYVMETLNCLTQVFILFEL